MVYITPIWITDNYRYTYSHMGDSYKINECHGNSKLGREINLTYVNSNNEMAKNTLLYIQV